MANKIAPYKDKYYLEAVEQWWEGSASQSFRAVEDMFIGYTQWALGEGAYRRVLSVGDFEKCVMKIGVRLIGSGEYQDFVRAETWRPSDEVVMRSRGLGVRREQ